MAALNINCGRRRRTQFAMPVGTLRATTTPNDVAIEALCNSNSMPVGFANVWVVAKQLP